MALIEQIAKRARGARIYLDDATGLFRTEVTLHDQCYQDSQGIWQIVDDSFISDSGGFNAQCITQRKWVRVAANGTRRIYPDRNVTGEYVEFGIPQFFNGSVWNNINLPNPTQPSSKIILWDAANYSMRLFHSPNRLKLDITLKNSNAAKQIRWPVSLNNLTWNTDWTLTSQSTNEVVARIEKIFGTDANGTIVPINTSFDSGFVEFTADLTGLTFPIVIDPTYSSQPDPGTDTSVAEAEPTTNKGTNEEILVNDPGFAGFYHNGLVLFDLSSIPAGSTINSATLSVWKSYLRAAGSNFYGVVNFHRILSGNDWTETGATWNTRDGTNNWLGGNNGCDTSGTDYSATSMGSVSIANADAESTEYNITLDAAEMALMLANNVGFLFKHDPTVTQSPRMNSSDAATSSANYPKLVIDYSAGAPFIPHPRLMVT